MSSSDDSDTFVLGEAVQLAQIFKGFLENAIKIEAEYLAQWDRGRSIPDMRSAVIETLKELRLAMFMAREAKQVNPQGPHLTFPLMLLLDELECSAEGKAGPLLSPHGTFGHSRRNAKRSRLDGHARGRAIAIFRWLKSELTLKESDSAEMVAAIYQEFRPSIKSETVIEWSKEMARKRNASGVRDEITSYSKWLKALDKSIPTTKATVMTKATFVIADFRMFLKGITYSFDLYASKRRGNKTRTSPPV